MKPIDTEKWKLSDWALLAYRLRLHKPIAARGANKHIRHGFLVIKKNPWGIGIGEAAPISGFHPIDELRVQEELRQALRDPASRSHCSAITTCALEMASYKPFPHGSIPINGLLTHAGNVDPQFSCYKIKVGRASIDDDIAMLKHISNTIAPNTRIRLDANGAWTLSECLDFWSRVRKLPLHIAYIEEPLQHPEHYPKLPFPFALDERLEQYTGHLDKLTQLQAIIIKPSLLGFSRSLHWIEHASKMNVTAVISSTFESSIGLFSYAQLASLQPQTHAGLGTASWFLDDLLVHRAIPQRGCLPSVHGENLISQLQWRHLSVIDHSGIDLA